MRSLLRAGEAPAPPPPPSAVFRDIEAIPAGSIGFNYREALEAVVQAQGDAERILNDARAEADRVRDAARGQAAQMHIDAHAKGYAEGAEQARREAREAALAAAAEQHAELREDLEAFCQAVQDEQERVWRAAEVQVRELALEIARRVLKAEVSVNPDVVTEITRHALRRLAGTDQVRIRVNPDDVERLRARREELMALFEGLHAVEILEDRRVGIGGVQIETESGTLDARIETQLGEIARALAD